MLRLDIRLLVGAAFMTAVGMVACGGGSGTSGPAPNPSNLIPTPTPKPTPTPTPLPSGVTPTPVAATIIYTGSAEFSPFAIVLQVTGNAQVTEPSAYTPVPGTVPTSITSQFFKDLNKYAPVNKLPIGSCSRPTGTAYNNETAVVYQNEESGDVSCPGGASTTAIYSDIKSVETSLGITPPT